MCIDVEFFFAKVTMKCMVIKQMLSGILINKLIVWFNSYTALSLHPVRLSALAHYKLVYIHPFHDGNGRTSRLLMNLVLMQAGYPPVIIRRADRELYYK